MFGRRKKEAEAEQAEAKQAGPYRVDNVVPNTALQALLNKRYAEGYEVVQILPNYLSGTNNGRAVVFRLRD